MTNNYLKILILILLYGITLICLKPDNKEFKILEIYSPINMRLSNFNYKIKDLDAFDTSYTAKNYNLSKKLNITEDEAFIIGILGKYWAENFLLRRSVTIKNNDIIFLKRNYTEKFYYSAYCIKDDKPCSASAFNNLVSNIRKSNYKAINVNTNDIFEIEQSTIKNLSNYVIVKSSHLKWAKFNEIKNKNNLSKHAIFSEKNMKLFLTDFTENLRPSRECSTSICKEILFNINNAKETIDIAIYGYSNVNAIEDALLNAIKRGVKIRLVYDTDKKGRNIYPDTKNLVKILSNNSSDVNSTEAESLMHNKFYIFDKKILITGSANLSHTDMSGYNTNSVLFLNSKEIAKIYLKEFEQMYLGKYHNDKQINEKQSIILDNSILTVSFSPQDKSIKKLVLPLIKNAKEYIYIPTFVLTDKQVVNELINAKKRGIDIKIIIDALNASIKHSKHSELRTAGLTVKTENYAGKMHSKAMLIDDKYTLIGSMNFSNSGENKNDENIIIIENSEMTKFYKRFFLYQWSKIDNKWLYKNVRAEGKDSIGSCFDGIDNNYDGLIDKDDIACN